jgi:hypothetical protein
MDVKKPGSLMGIFSPFEGSVKHGGHAGDAVVLFPDAKSLASARMRVGGGVRGIFRVQNVPANAVHSATDDPIAGHGSEPGAGVTTGGACAESARRATTPAPQAAGPLAGGSTHGRWSRVGWDAEGCGSGGGGGGAAGQSGASASVAGAKSTAESPVQGVAKRNPFTFLDDDVAPEIEINGAVVVGVNTSVPQARDRAEPLAHIDRVRLGGGSGYGVAHLALNADVFGSAAHEAEARDGLAGHEGTSQSTTTTPGKEVVDNWDDGTL